MLKKICALLAMTVLLSGCVKMETDLTIYKNGSAVVKDRFMVNKQLIAMSKQDPFKDIMNKKQQNADTKVLPYETEEMKGFEATTHMKNLETAKWNSTAESKSVKTKNPDGKFVSVKRSFVKTVYTIDAEIDASKDTDNNPGSQRQMDSLKNSGADINNIFQVNYIVRTPVKADSNNATTADDTNFVYKWQMNFGEINPIKLQFTVYNTGNIIGAIVILLIIIAAVMTKKNSKKE